MYMYMYIWAFLNISQNGGCSKVFEIQPSRGVFKSNPCPIGAPWQVCSPMFPNVMALDLDGMVPGYGILLVIDGRYLWKINIR